MKSTVVRFVPSLLLLIAPLVLAFVLQSGRVQFASAQTAVGTAVPTAVQAGTSVSICGGVTLFTAATATTTGSITFSTTSVVNTYPILAGVTLVGQNAISTGVNMCLSGLLDASGRIVSGVITANNSTTFVVCGPVTTYTASTGSALGLLTIAGIRFPTALGASFTGTTVAVGANLCITAQLSSLGNVVGGNAIVNSTGASSLTGPFTTYTPPTATTDGFITFGTSTFFLPAGSTITVGGSVPLSATLVGGGHRAGMIPL
jgi:hypothetical protein